MQQPLYRVHAWCPRCDKTLTRITAIIPNPRIKCPHCFREGFKTPVEMKIVAAEQVDPIG